MTFLVFILACWGLTQILCYGSIFDSIRPKHSFFKCPMCIGWWVGFAMCLVFLTGLPTVSVYLNPFIYAFVSSGTSYALCTVFGDDGINLSKK